MPIKWKSKIFLVKTETTYGTDAAPTGAANAVLATDITLYPMEGQDVSREQELPWLAAQATTPAGLHARLTYRVELAPSGSVGVAPAWGPLLRACAVTQTLNPGTSVVYTPISDNHESVTKHLWVGGTRFAYRGNRGNAVLRYTAQGIPVIDFDFRGLFSVPSEQARPTPVLTGFKKPQIVTSTNTPTFTVDGIAVPTMVMRNFSLDLGNDVQTRFLVGSDSVLIVDRAEQVAFQMEALPLTTWDPFTKALNEATVAASLVHGTGAGRISTLSIPAMQLQRPNALANQQNIAEWPLRATPLPTSGNDQWSLTLT